ncbi:MAG: diaminopimelate decarboxylase [Bacteroidales bacterium]
MTNRPNIDRLLIPDTPFYYYDLNILRKTLNQLKNIQEKYGFIIHYAVKANANSRILRIIKNYGLGADCVSGNEITHTLSNGFKPENIVYAGVGKSDREIDIALDNNIAFFNCESLAEIEVINERASLKNQTARIALRINPEINANTHQYITTGVEENKFGINRTETVKVIRACKKMKNIKLQGLHVHIGSQIQDVDIFKSLCLRINELQEVFRKEGVPTNYINVGGGLGINYEHPEENSIPDFHSYFKIFNQFLDRTPNHRIHFELGRSVVGQCGCLVTRVLYVKEGLHTKFAIVDAGMTELIRPALYQASHKIINLTSNKSPEKYDVVGPICESSDYFGKNVLLKKVSRGDRLLIYSTGAYGEVMRSNYNLREHVKSHYSEDFPQIEK